MQGDLAQDEPERATVLIAYGLMLGAIMGGITALIGMVIAMVRVGDARGSVWESHYRNIIAVFWVGAALFLTLIGAALTGMLAMAGMAIGNAWMDGDALLALPLLGLTVPFMMLAWLLFCLWYFYRLLRGLLRALDGRAY